MAAQLADKDAHIGALVDKCSKLDTALQVRFAVALKGECGRGWKHTQTVLQW